jgi:anaerobic magnesium-protoporphyrin IX monomethyl ester cyclase
MTAGLDMKIVLIDVSNSRLGVGIRYLSSYVREKGHETKLVFLPDKTSSHRTGNYEKIDEKTIRQLAAVCQDADFVGLSVFSNFYLHAVDITNELRKLLDIPIIWGGIHPTADPESSIKYADAICIGEGEETLLELLDHPERTDIHGMWFRKGDGITRNSTRPLQTDIDSYPPQDYDIEHHYFFNGDEIIKLDDASFQEMMKPRGIVDKSGRYLLTYYTLISRGCPYRCAYCCNNLYAQLYGPVWNKLRRRSPGKVIAELKAIKKRFPFFHNVAVIDDAFMAAGDSEIEEFALIYKKEIGMPFRCITTPISISERKMSALVDAGLYGVEMGIQTGSERLNKEVYKRFVPNEHVFKAAKILNKYPHIVPRYDIIMDCPWENEDDIVKTINVVSQLPKPNSLTLFSLTFYPGSELAKRALEEGKIKDFSKDVYLKPYSKQQTYENLSYLDFILVLGSYLPNRLLAALARKEARAVFNHRQLNPAYVFLYKNRNKFRKLATALTNPWSKRVSKEREFDA